MYKYLLLCLFSLNLFAQVEIPALKYYVNDYTGTITSDEFRILNQKLKAFDDSTSTQIVFLMVSTLNDMPITDYSIRTANQNKIGTEKNKNGVLFVVAKDDREMRIEVGRGLEGPLPDALARRIIDNDVAPHFKKKKFSRGVEHGLTSIMQAVKGEYKDKKDDPVEGIVGAVVAIIALILVFIFRGGMGGGGRGRRVGNMIFWGGLGGSSGWGSRTGGFGSSSGGGFGGFSGGGGSFGGGGSSGSW